MELYRLVHSDKELIILSIISLKCSSVCTMEFSMFRVTLAIFQNLENFLAVWC